MFGKISSRVCLFEDGRNCGREYLFVNWRGEIASDQVSEIIGPTVYLGFVLVIEYSGDWDLVRITPPPPLMIEFSSGGPTQDVLVE